MTGPWALARDDRASGTSEMTGPRELARDDRASGTSIDRATRYFHCAAVAGKRC